MRVSIATLLAAAYTGLATACSQQPVGSNPSGNPISAPVLQVVEAGKPFTITWNVRIEFPYFSRLLTLTEFIAYHPRNRVHCASPWSCDQCDPHRLPGR